MECAIPEAGNELGAAVARPGAAVGTISGSPRALESPHQPLCPDHLSENSHPRPKPDRSGAEFGMFGCEVALCINTQHICTRGMCCFTARLAVTPFFESLFVYLFTALCEIHLEGILFPPPIPDPAARLSQARKMGRSHCLHPCSLWSILRVGMLSLPLKLLHHAGGENDA